MPVKSFFIILGCCLMISITAHADLFVKKKGSAIPPSMEAPPRGSVAEDYQMDAPEEKTPETIEAFADKYYESCMSKKDDVLKGKAQKMLCACSSANMAEKMTVHEVRVMATDTPEGLQQRNRMLLQVYAPCMEYPTQALLHHRCMNDESIKTSIPNYPDVCNCIADNTAEFVKQNAPQTLAKALKDDPKNLDPMASLMNSPEFQHNSQTTLMACLAQYQPPATQEQAPAQPSGQP